MIFETKLQKNFKNDERPIKLAMKLIGQWKSKKKKKTLKNHSTDFFHYMESRDIFVLSIIVNKVNDKI